MRASAFPIGGRTSQRSASASERTDVTVGFDIVDQAICQKLCDGTLLQGARLATLCHRNSGRSMSTPTAVQRSVTEAEQVTTPSTLALVARQPIYGPAMTVVAYELLYADTPASDATLRVVTDAALEIGLDRLAGGLPVHINYPAQLLAARLPLSIHPDRVVIEVLQAD